MSQFVWANNCSSTLSGGITSTATSLTLASSANLPTLAAGQILALTLNDAATRGVFEVVYATAISGAVCTITRGEEGTAAQAWLSGDFVYATVTAGELGGFLQPGAAGLVELSPASAQAGFIDITGDVTAGGFTGSGAGLTAVPTGSLTVPPVLAVLAGTGIGSTGGQDPSISNTGVLSAEGLTGAVSVTSPDSSITVGTSGQDITLEVASSKIGIGGAIFQAGNSLAPSQALPTYGTWGVELLWAFSSSANANASQTISLTAGTATGIVTTGDGYTSQNASYYSSALWAGTAAGSQTLTWSLATSGSHESNAWTIKCFRTA
ncbi:MAG: hypothetical protein ACYDCJ_13665 [Gammaproteobacteria bacterium]